MENKSETKKSNNKTVLTVIIVAIIIGALYGIAGYTFIDKMFVTSSEQEKELIKNIEKNHGKNYEILEIKRYGGGGESKGISALILVDNKYIYASYSAERLLSNDYKYREYEYDMQENSKY